MICSSSQQIIFRAGAPHSMDWTTMELLSKNKSSCWNVKKVSSEYSRQSVQSEDHSPSNKNLGIWESWSFIATEEETQGHYRVQTGNRCDSEVHKLCHACQSMGSNENQGVAEREFKGPFAVSSHRTFRINRFLAKKQKQNWPIPQWIRRKAGDKTRDNSKRRHRRRTQRGL